MGLFREVLQERKLTALGQWTSDWPTLPRVLTAEAHVKLKDTSTPIPAVFYEGVFVTGIHY
jgi:hypothetical protein